MVKVFATAQSPTEVSVTWSYDLGDEIPQLSVTILEFGPDGRQMEAKPNLPVLGGEPLFQGLTPETNYTYQWCGVFAGDPSNFTSCADPSTNAHVKTPKAGPPPPTPPPPTPPPPTPHPPPPGNVTVTAQARPFGKIAVSWGLAETAGLQRRRNGVDAGGLPVGANSTSIVDTGPFLVGSVYSYELTSFVAPQQIGVSFSNDVIYPAFIGIREFLHAGFDPSQGLKRLLPNDHPFVSVRKIMNGL